MPTFELNSTYTNFGPNYPTPPTCLSVFVVIITGLFERMYGTICPAGQSFLVHMWAYMPSSRISVCDLAKTIYVMPTNSVHEILGLDRGRKIKSSAPPTPRFYFNSRLAFVHGLRVETAGGAVVKGSQ